MQINTKYKLNQQVWKIANHPEKKWNICAPCSGEGAVILNDGKKRMCPECYGRKGSYVYLPTKWQITDQLTIGQIRYEITNFASDGDFDNIGHYEEGKNEIEESYMCYESGIRCGTIHRVDTLYPSIELAQEECDRRNNAK